MVSTERLWEYRILYNYGSECSALNNYHYYLATSATQAYEFHINALQKNGIIAQDISVERFDPYAMIWIDESPHLIIDHD